MDERNRILELRGRSSAGQRAVASLLVRMALAFAFGTGCGLLALDEPTAHMDHKSVNALADALGQLHKHIGDKMQLLVITHDKEFVRKLESCGVINRY